MKCTVVDSLIFDYVEGRLDPALTVRVTGHLAECNECASRVASWGEVYDALSSAPGPQVSDNFIEATLARVITQVGTPKDGLQTEEDELQTVESRSTPWWASLNTGFFRSETTRNVTASLAAALLLLLLSDVLVVGPNAPLARVGMEPVGTASTAEAAVSHIFITLGGWANGLFGWLLRLSGLVVGLL